MITLSIAVLLLSIWVFVGTWALIFIHIKYRMMREDHDVLSRKWEKGVDLTLETNTFVGKLFKTNDALVTQLKERVEGLERGIK